MIFFKNGLMECELCHIPLDYIGYCYRCGLLHKKVAFFRSTDQSFEHKAYEILTSREEKLITIDEFKKVRDDWYEDYRNFKRKLLKLSANKK